MTTPPPLPPSPTQAMSRCFLCCFLLFMFFVFFFRTLPTFSPYFTQMSLNSALVQIILQAKKLWPKKTVLFKQ